MKALSGTISDVRFYDQFTAWMNSPHVRMMSEYLEAVANGHRPRLRINLSPWGRSHWGRRGPYEAALVAREYTPRPEAIFERRHPDVRYPRLTEADLRLSIGKHFKNPPAGRTVFDTPLVVSSDAEPGMAYWRAPTGSGGWTVHRLPSEYHELALLPGRFRNYSISVQGSELDPAGEEKLTKDRMERS